MVKCDHTKHFLMNNIKSLRHFASKSTNCIHCVKLNKINLNKIKQNPQCHSHIKFAQQWYSKYFLGIYLRQRFDECNCRMMISFFIHHSQSKNPVAMGAKFRKNCVSPLGQMKKHNSLAMILDKKADCLHRLPFSRKSQICRLCVYVVTLQCLYSFS